MKKATFLNNKIIIFLFAIFLFATPGVCQDTLHLNYVALQTKMPDSTETKIAKWAKNLKGQHVDVEAVCYYSQPEFKKYAAERSEEIFLVLNRKARDLITITKNVTKKGSKSQKSRVDIIYWPTGTVILPKEKQIKSASTNSALADSEKEKQEKEKNDEKVKQLELENKYGKPDKRQAGEGQLVKKIDVQQIKESKIIVAQIGNKPLDEALLKAVKIFWSFTKNISTMPYKEAKELAKTDEKVLIIFTTITASKSLPNSSAVVNFGSVSTGVGEGERIETQYIKVSAGNAIMIENGKGKIVAASYLPSLGEDGALTSEIIDFGICDINYLLKTMYEKDMPDNSKFEPVYKELALDKLKEKTLYIPEFWLDESFNQTEISNIYKAKSEVVSYDTWKDVIINQKEGSAYVIISPRPSGGAFIYKHYIVDAETRAIYAVCAPKTATTSNKSTAEVISAFNIEKYNSALSGDW